MLIAQLESVNSVGFWQIFQRANLNAEVVQNAVLKSIYQSVDSQLSSLFPGFLYDWNSCDVFDVLLYVKLYQKVFVFLLRSLSELLSVSRSQVSDVRKP